MSPEDCEASLSRLSISESECSDINKLEQAIVYILADFTFFYTPEGIMRRPLVDYEELTADKVELILPRDLLLDESWGRLMVTAILSALGVPVRCLRYEAESLLEAAQFKVGSTEWKSSTVLPMRHYIQCYVNGAEEVDAVLKSESIKAKYSLMGLTKVKVEGEAGTTCSICLEDIPSGSVAASLPCSHVYHHNCIIPWLVRTETCPLCRFQSPDIAEYI